MMLAATLPFLALCVISIHARALVANDGIAVRDTSPTSPAEELISLAPSSPVIDDLDLEASSSTTSSNTTVVSDDAIPATVQGNSSSVLNPQSPVALDPHSYHVPGTPITLMLAKLGAALPAGPADDALEAVLDQLNLEIRTSGDQMSKLRTETANQHGACLVSTAWCFLYLCSFQCFQKQSPYLILILIPSPTLGPFDPIPFSSLHLNVFRISSFTPAFPCQVLFFPLSPPDAPTLRHSKADITLRKIKCQECIISPKMASISRVITRSGTKPRCATSKWAFWACRT